MNFLEILILFFSFQALVLSVLFFIRWQGDRIANRILAIFLLLFSYNLFFNVLYWSGFDRLLFLSLSFTYLLPISLYGPLFYFYVRRVVAREKFNWKDGIHLLPFLFLVSYFSPIYVLAIEEKLELFRAGKFTDHIGLVIWFGSALVLLMFGYGCHTYFRFIRNYKDDAEMALWLKTISLFFITFSISHIIYRILLLLELTDPEFDYYITLFMIFLIGCVCYFGFIYASVFNGTPMRQIIPFVKYEKTGMSAEFSLEMKAKLEKIMLEEKPFLDPDIRLDSLAELLDLSRHHASQIINEHFSMNFFEFINQHRVQEAKKLLSRKSPDLFINDIAYLSGFNNRISFYKAFKKNVGETPSDFRDRCNYS